MAKGKVRGLQMRIRVTSGIHMSLRHTISVAGILAIAVLLTGCDETHTFTFVNQTQKPIRVEWYVVGNEEEIRSADGDVLALNAGEAISTEEKTGESGDRGASIFYRGLFLRVRATSNGTVVFEKLFPYAELKNLDFTVTIESSQPP